MNCKLKTEQDWRELARQANWSAAALAIRGLFGLIADYSNWPPPPCFGFCWNWDRLQIWNQA
jgi:hypothetical protein